MTVTLDPVIAPSSTCEISSGLTISEALDAMQIAEGFRPNTITHKNGTHVFLEDWDTVCLEEGDALKVTVLPTGSGVDNALAGAPKDTLRLFAGLAVAAGANAIIPGSGVFQTLARAGLTIAGMGLVNSMIPLPGPPPDPESPDLANLTGVRNRVKPYEAVPKLYGQHKLIPPMASRPFTETDEDGGQWIRAVYLLGYAPMDIDVDTLLFGNLPSEDFTENDDDSLEIAWSTELTDGSTFGTIPDLYRNNVLETQFSDLLLSTYSNSDDPPPADLWLNSDGDLWPQVVTRLTASDTTEIGVQVTFPAGLYIERDGSPGTRVVYFEIQWRRLGDGESGWMSVVDLAYENRREAIQEDSEDDLWTLLDDIATEMGVINAIVGAHPGANRFVTTQYQYSMIASLARTRINTLTLDDSGDPSYPAIKTAVLAAVDAAQTLVAGFQDPVEDEDDCDPDFLIDMQRYRKDIEYLQASVTVTKLRQVHGQGEWEATNAYYRKWAVYVQWRDFIQNATPLTQHLQRISDATPSIVRRSVRWSVGEAGTFKVRVRRHSRDLQQGGVPGRATDALHWTHLRSFRNGPAVNMEDVAVLAVRAKASDKLSGSLDTVSVIATARLLTWTIGGGWSTEATATRNPAWAYCDILHGSANKRRQLDGSGDPDNLDMPTIKAWADWCDANGYTYDRVYSRTTTVMTALREAAAAGRANPVIRDGIYSVAHDDTQTGARQHFTEENCWGMQGNRSLQQLPQALRVRFINPDADWGYDEVTVYDDGFTKETPPDDRNVQTVQLEGVLDSHLEESSWRTGQVYKFGRYMLAHLQLRPEVFEIQVDWENLVCERGDLVYLSHRFIQVGYGSARIVSITGAVGARTAIEISELTTLPSGTTYRAVMRNADIDTFLVSAVDANPSESNTLTFSSPLVDTLAPIAVGGLVAWGETGEEKIECLVRDITPGADFSARLSLIPYNAAVYSADTEDIPDYDPHITRPPDPQILQPPRPVILDVRSDETVLIRQRDGSLPNVIRITLAVPTPTTVEEEAATQNISGLEIHYRQTPPVVALVAGESNLGTEEWIRLPVFTENLQITTILGVVAGTFYDIRARYIASGAIAGQWASVVGHEVIGKTSPPPDVGALQIDGENSRLVWNYSQEPLDFAGFYLRFALGASTTWGRAAPAHHGLVKETGFDVRRFVNTKPTTFLLKAADIVGNVSVNPAEITVTWPEDVRGVLLREVDYQAAYWPGTYLNATIDGSNELVADEDDNALFWGDDGDPFWGPDDELFWVGWYAEIRYFFDILILASELPCDIRVELTTEGDVEGRIEYYEPMTNMNFWPEGDLEGKDISFADLDIGQQWTTGGTGWLPFPGSLRPEAAGRYKFRVIVPTGKAQGKITGLTVRIDAPIIEEYFANVAIGAVGQPRLVLTKSFRAILTVMATTQTSGDGMIVRTWDKLGTIDDVETGPALIINDENGSQVAGQADVLVRGY